MLRSGTYLDCVLVHFWIALDTNKVINKDLVDIVAFGRYYIPNPDLVERFKNGYPLAEIKDSHTLFGGRDEVGFTDYLNY
ncbi:MAG TPA: hypothetical protein EYG93_03610 [Sulfurospirillum arcachonense]|nr:hypothetical protein [Sulfurospirillum arcachonense]HIP44405.1 hypothetical protein [Sulfurospirillum arcachonense]